MKCDLGCNDFEDLVSVVVCACAYVCMCLRPTCVYDLIVISCMLILFMCCENVCGKGLSSNVLSSCCVCFTQLD